MKKIVTLNSRPEILRLNSPERTRAAGELSELVNAPAALLGGARKLINGSNV